MGDDGDISEAILAEHDGLGVSVALGAVCRQVPAALRGERGSDGAEGVKVASLPAVIVVAALHRFGFVDGDGAAIVVRAIQFCDRGLRLGIGCHLDKAETLATSRIAIGDERGGFNSAEGAKFLGQVLFADRIRQIPDI